MPGTWAPQAATEAIAPLHGNTDGFDLRERLPQVATLELDGFEVVVTHGDVGSPTPSGSRPRTPRDHRLRAHASAAAHAGGHSGDGDESRRRGAPPLQPPAVRRHPRSWSPGFRRARTLGAVLPSHRVIATLLLAQLQLGHIRSTALPGWTTCLPWAAMVRHPDRPEPGVGLAGRGAGTRSHASCSHTTVDWSGRLRYQPESGERRGSALAPGVPVVLPAGPAEDRGLPRTRTAEAPRGDHRRSGPERTGGRPDRDLRQLAGRLVGPPATGARLAGNGAGRRSSLSASTTMDRKGGTRTGTQAVSVERTPARWVPVTLR